ncbi:hypothetical protein JCM16303_000808 [Sporobolomyces ruberrimus]
MSDSLYEYLDPQLISPSLECPICRSPLVDPIMPRACQHLFCAACLHRALDSSPTCPIDRARIRNRKEELVEAPRVVLELLGELRVSCGRCEVKMKREEWARHEVACRDQLTGTKEGKEGAAKEVPDLGADGHEAVVDTEVANLRCEHCEERLPTSLLESHEEQCSARPRPCQHCSALLAPPSLASHLLDSCPLVPAPCPHAPFGCSYSGPRESLSTDHLYSECPYEPLKECFERFKEREREWEGENWRLRRKVEGLEARLEDVEGVLGDTRYSLGDYLVPVPDEKSLELQSPPPVPPLKNALSSLSSRNVSLSSSLSTLTQSHTDSLHTTQYLVDELNSMRSVIGGMRMQMGELMRTVQFLSSSSARGRGGGGVGMGEMRGGSIGRPGFESRRSDSSSADELLPDHEPPFHDMDQYLSSSISDPEEDLPPLLNRSRVFARPPPPIPMGPYASRFPPSTNGANWASGYEYGGGGGVERRNNWGEGPPSLFSFGPGSIPPPRPLYPPGPGHVGRMNGRVVGGIGGGMKL